MTETGTERESQAGVGSLLCKTRQSLGKDLGAVAKELRIRQIYLTAIEDQRYRDLPGRAYAQGFVRAYAEYLALDGDEIVRRFKQECGVFASRAELVFPSAVSESSLPSGRLLVLALVVAALAYGAWYVYQSRVPSIAEGVPPLPERLASLIHQPVAGSGTEVVSAPRADSPKSVEPASAPSSAVPVPAPAPIASAPQAETPPAPQPQPQAQAPSAAVVAPVQPQPQPSHEDVVPPPEEEQNSQPTASVPSQDAAVSAKPADAKLSAKALREAKKAEALAKQAAQAQDKPADAVAQAATPAAPSAAASSDVPVEKMATVETMRTDAAKTQPDMKPLAQDQATASSSRVRLNAQEDCWIEIRDSTTGQVVHSRLLRKGESYYVPNRSGLMLTAGNAGAMVIMVDGKSMVPLGRLGMVRRDISLDPDRLNGTSGD